MTLRPSIKKTATGPLSLLGASAAAYCIVLAVFVLCLSPACPASTAEQKPAARQEVLVLSSYHAGFAWDDSIKQAITDVLKPEENKLDLHFEYMDTKRLNDAGYIRILHDLYRYKYRSTSFALIIASDNFSFDFLREYRNELFPGVPVVFCGVNFFQDAMLAGQQLFTGAAEEFDAAATVDILLKLHPTTQELFVLNDGDLTGQAWANDIRKQIAGRYPKLKVRYAEPMTKAQAIAYVQALPADTVVLLGVFLRDTAGEYVSAPDFARQLTAAGSVPIYGLLDLYMGYGIVGGAIIDGYHQGELAAGLAQRVLHGEPADTIPVIKQGVTRPMFDYEQIQRFHIAESALPKDSIIIHKPYSFYDDNKGKIFATATFVIVASVLIFFLTFTLVARRKVEGQLRDSQQRLALTLEAVDEGVWDRNVQTGEMLCSPRCYTMLDYTPEEFPKDFKAWVHICHPDDAVLAEQKIRWHFEHGDIFAIELRMRNKSGSWRWILARGMVVSRDTAGNPLQMVGTHADITERKNAEIALKASEERYRILIESMGEGLILIDQYTNITYTNQQFRLMTGYSEQELLGRPFQALMSDQSKAIFRAQHEQRRKGLSKYYELEILKKDGAVVLTLLFPKSLYDEEGRFNGSFATTFDITERKRAEAELLTYRDHLEDMVRERTTDLEKAKETAEIASKAKSAFLANMSHELRTPLNAILGFTQIIAKDQAATQGQKENLAIILKSGEHLLTLINSVLDLAKIEAGKVQVEITEFDLADLILDLITMLRGRAESKGLRLFLDQSSSFPRFIKSDPAKLRQILINLVGNAIKFTKEGSVTVKLAVLALNQGTKKLELAFDIIDTGPGMAQSDIERIFSPFEQGKQKNFTEGTGLGLAIAREFITMLHGSISAISELGKGSTFHFTIEGEAVDIKGVEEIRQTLGDIVAIDHATECKILVVDDQPENRLLLKQLLTPYGFQYREASNGEEGVAISRHWQPHCVLMDRRMPVMDGMEATRAIRELDLSPRPVIIAVTAHAYKEEQATMLAAGCDDFLGKPFKDADLFDHLEKHLPITISRTAQQADQSAGVEDASLHSSLAMLPEDVLTQLQQASLRCDRDLISNLLKPFPETYNTLKPLLDNFRYDSLIDVIDQQLQATT